VRQLLLATFVAGISTGALRGADRPTLLPGFEIAPTVDRQKPACPTEPSPSDCARQPRAFDGADDEHGTCASENCDAVCASTRDRLAQPTRRDIVFVRAGALEDRTIDFTLDGSGAHENRIVLPAADLAAIVATEPVTEAVPEAELVEYKYFQDATDSSDTVSGSVTGSRMSRWESQPITSLGVNIGMPDGLLPNASQDTGTDRNDPLCVCADCPRPWCGTNYCFCATALCYNPLYFEEINLERYGFGYSDCLQPVCSAAHFFGRVPCLPCMMLRDCPFECNYTLGHYRPGSCNPWRPVGCCRL
jgi:hypothetical protein